MIRIIALTTFMIVGMTCVVDADASTGFIIAGMFWLILFASWPVERPYPRWW